MLPALSWGPQPEGGTPIQQALCPILIGREKEQTLLEDALLAANRGEGQMVVLAGEAGVGKTRLAKELQRRARKIGMAVLWGGCSEADLALPYLPFLEAIGNYLGGSDLEQVRAEFGPVRRELANLFPQLEPEASPADAGDPTQAKLRLFEALLTLLGLPARKQGLLLVLEDLHRADASTRELLDYLTRRLRGTRILVLGSYRSDELHRKHPLLPSVQGWRRSELAEVIDLETLSPPGVADMVAAIFDYEHVTDEFRDFLHQRSDGNPFVLEEILKAAIDRGDIYRTPTHWERKELAELKLPQTVKDTVLLRVERMTDEQAAILRTAAVLGLSFSYAALVAVSGGDRSVVQAALHTFVQLQLMEEDPPGTGRFRFRHALTREAIYEDLITPTREQLHARAAEVLRSQSGTAAIDLAFHMVAANRWDEALPLAVKAAEDAERSHAYRVAMDIYERILSHVTDGLTRGQMLCRLGNACHLAVDPGRAYRYLEQGIQLLEENHQRREAARYRITLGRCHWERARSDLAQMEYERARDTLERDGPSEDLAQAYIRLAGLHEFDHRFKEALVTAERAAAVAEAAHAENARIWALVFLGGALVGLGRVDEGLAKLDESYQAALARGQLGIARNALYNANEHRTLNFRAREALARMPLFRELRTGDRLHPIEAFAEGHALFFMGYPEKARGQFERALALAQEGQASVWAGWSQRELAMTLSELGQPEEARRLIPPPESQVELQDRAYLLPYTIRIRMRSGDLEGAVRLADVVKNARWGGLHDMRFAFDAAVEALLAADRADEAERLVTRSRGKGDPGPRAYQDRMEGRLALAQNDLPTARQKLQTAADFFHDVGAGLEALRSQRALAAVLARLGNTDGAVATLRTILADAGDRGATFEAEEARRQLAELGIAIETVVPARKEAATQPSERLVTVMFVDVRGYTATASREAPADLADTISSFYRWTEQEIERHHGSATQHAGDAVMATFNVSGARLDHTQHALQAAVAIRDKAAVAGLPVGIGIAVGPAIVGQFSEKSAPTALGETVNLAARLQAQAAAGQILLSGEAYRRTASWLAEADLTPERALLTLKGFDSEVPAYRVGSISTA